MIRKYELPDEINIDGVTLKPVIGGHLENIPFLTVDVSGVDVTKSGWGNLILPFSETNLIIKEAKAKKLKYRKVSVLSRNLRGKLDLHGRPYKGTVWVFVQVSSV